MTLILDVSPGKSTGKSTGKSSPALWAFQQQYNFEEETGNKKGGALVPAVQPELNTQRNIKQLVRQKQAGFDVTLREEELYRFLSDSGLSNCDSKTQIEAVQKWKISKAQEALQQPKEYSSWWWLKAVAVFSSKRAHRRSQVSPV
jgi:hypothetical protein